MLCHVRLIILGLILSMLQSVSPAQVTGIYDFGPFDSLGFDSINRGNLNTHFSIPIFSKIGRGGSNFYYALNYDGLIWSPTSSDGTAEWTPVAEWGWTDVTNAQWGYVTFNTEFFDCTLPPKGLQSQYTAYNQFVYHDNKGNAHAIPFAFTNSCGKMGTPTGTGTYQLTDNSGYTIYRNGMSFTAVTKYGAVFSVPHYLLGTSPQSKPGSASAEDTNGNMVSASSTGSSTASFTDTMGKTALTVSGVAPSPVIYTYTDSNGSTQHVTVNYTSVTVQTAFGASGVAEYSQTNVPLVSSIVYSADNSQYTFTYEHTPGSQTTYTGRIAGITLRTGGTINYAYTGVNQGIEPDGTTAGLTRTTSDGATTYARSGISSSQSTTTFTDASGNATVSSFLLNSGYFYETDHKTYAGSATGTPLSEVQTCYNTSQAGCSGNSVSSAFSSILRYSYQNGGMLNSDYQTFSGPELVQSDSDLTGITTYYDYNAYTNTYGIPFYRLADEYQKVGSRLLSKSVYTYDGTTPTSTSGLPQHASVTTPRGNLTQVQQWLDSTGSSPINTTYAYDDAGQVLSTTDTNGKTTTYSYDASTDTLLTGTTFPAVNGVQLSQGYQLDTNTGLQLSTTDANGNVTSYAYDGLLRPTEVNSPDSGITKYTYPTANQLSTYVYQTSSVYTDSENIYDGYGRLIRIATANGQGGNPWYLQDICYDSSGNVGFKSYRYQAGGLNGSQVCSGTGGDAFSYDALGRALKITHGDGTSANMSYNMGTSQSIDENNVTRLTTHGVHGLITGVCEISSNGSMPGSGTPSACNMDIAGTGFKTTYGYDFLNHKTTVTQGVQSRVFQTDWVGRPILVQEPESGQTTYSYAYNTTGLQVTRQRPQANQGSASVLTSTTTQFDALGRALSITYSDGTPTKTFVYDTGAGWSDLAQANLKGRLSIASVTGASTVFSYDSVGRISYLDECLPSGCGNIAYNRQLHYVYDLSGNVMNSTDGTAVKTSYTVSPANEVLSVTSSLNNSENPPNLVSNVQNGPNGPFSYSLGNLLSNVYTYDALGRLNGGWVCSGSTSAYCSGGNQTYGFTVGWKGVQLTGSADTVLNQGSTYNYDEFNRIASRTVNSGATQNFTYIYDRYGNRAQQNVTSGSGPAPQFSFNTATNQINTGGYAYDAAGNMINDTYHSYTYDAEGNVTAVDGGSTAQYTYNALNQRVRTVVNGTAAEFVFNASGQRVSVWDGTSHNQLRGQYYLGSKPLAYYANGSVHFQHQDWLGTERLRTTYNGGVEGSFTSLPFGDSQTTNGTDGDAYHFAMLDHDAESDTDHAQFRQYSNVQGRWLSPDPYSGSYDPSNPQSLNRYAYVQNAPLSAADPSGLYFAIQCEDGKGCVFLGPGDPYGGFLDEFQMLDMQLAAMETMSVSLTTQNWSTQATLSTDGNFIFGQTPGTGGTWVTPTVAFSWTFGGTISGIPTPQRGTQQQPGTTAPNNGKQNPCGTSCHSPNKPLSPPSKSTQPLCPVIGDLGWGAGGIMGPWMSFETGLFGWIFGGELGAYDHFNCH